MTKKVTQNFAIPSKTLRTGKFFQLLSTKLAAKFAMKAFLSPVKFNTPEREQMMQKSAKAISFHVDQLDREITVYEYGFSKTRILLCHAWSGRGTQLYEIADSLLENGMMVITYDAPAHGQSSGTRTTILENLYCIEAITKKFGPFHAAIGHSFGGISLLVAQAQHPFLSKLVTIGIAGYTADIIESFVDKLGLSAKVAQQIISDYESQEQGLITKTSAAEAAKKVEIPTLIVHDTEDKDVDVSNAYKIRQNLEDGRLLISSGLGHRKIIRNAATIRSIIKFIKP